MNNDFYVAPHLRYSEIVSPDNDTGALTLDLLEAWVKLRGALGVPIRLTSAYRSIEYNRRVAGSPNSQHLLGRAIDIIVPNVNLDTPEWLEVFFECGFVGIGRGGGITHLDVREHGSGLWRYTGASRVPDEAGREAYERFASRDDMGLATGPRTTR